MTETQRQARQWRYQENLNTFKTFYAEVNSTHRNLRAKFRERFAKKLASLYARHATLVLEDYYHIVLPLLPSIIDERCKREKLNQHQALKAVNEYLDGILESSRRAILDKGGVEERIEFILKSSSVDDLENL